MKKKNTIAAIPKGSNIQLTSNFNSNEFDCKCSYSSCNTTLIDLEHLLRLQRLRNLIGPITINSAFRCKKHNKDVGGVPTSQHTKGTATDIKSSRMTPEMIRSLAKGIFDGLGIYDTFNHLDSRGTPAEWDKRGK